ncbi:MAG: peptidase, partial [Rhodospirillales bacterium]|nr:peptidase [Rhodospirillales bacterium]
GGEWCPYGMGGLSPELPLDQREEDGGSLLFDSEPLKQPITILGAPMVELEIEADQPAALVAVRLNDLRPDGSDLRVSYGVLNLTHREGHDKAVPLPSGKPVRVRVQMNEIGHVFPAGHRIRLALSTAYWPIIWPSPRPVRLRVHVAGSRLVLPLRERQPGDDKIGFEPPVTGRETRRRLIKGSEQERTITRDVTANEQIYEVARSDHSVIEEIGVETSFDKKVVYRIKPDDPTSARVDLREAYLNRHSQGWDTFVEAVTALSATETEFLVEASLKAFEGGKPFFARSWLERIPRNGV